MATEAVAAAESAERATANGERRSSTVFQAAVNAARSAADAVGVRRTAESGA
jgi:hypothetical protein